MTHPALRETQKLSQSPFIAMHVRRGDITRVNFTPEILRNVKQYPPLSWFVAMARAVRRSVPLRHLPIIVFTDGSADEIAELLQIENVRMADRQPAMADIWALAKAKILFASGYSSFSLWASYLGAMPTFYGPGKLSQLVQTGLPSALECELVENAEIPSGAIARMYQ